MTILYALPIPGSFPSVVLITTTTPIYSVSPLYSISTSNYCKYFQLLDVQMSFLGLPNVTLMKKSDSVWCVAQGDAATSALAWTSKSDELERGGEKNVLKLLFLCQTNQFKV